MTALSAVIMKFNFGFVIRAVFYIAIKKRSMLHIETGLLLFDSVLFDESAWDGLVTEKSHVHILCLIAGVDFKLKA